MKKIKLIIHAKERDLGGFNVRRFLPFATHKMVGPFIFFDHMGPATFSPGYGVDVRPHPHIHLATVTYLFAGKIRHRDSLGSNQLIEAGAVNWMVAGRGIVHSERTPDDLRQLGSSLNGIQCWLALPDSCENMPPSFTHYPAKDLPSFIIDKVELTLLLGKAFDHQSPVSAHSDLFYLNVNMPAGSKLKLPSDGRETAVYLVSGSLKIQEDLLNPFTMAVMHESEDIFLEALEDSELMLLGGKSVGPRYIYWNFVSSSKENIEQAKMDWDLGPGLEDSRFPRIPGDDSEFIPLPLEQQNPKGTIM